jgi:hypothetical protein
VQLDCEASAAYPHVEIGGGLLALDLVRVTIDQEGQNVAARDDSVDGNRLSVQAALPSIGCFFKLQTMWLAADDDFVKH